MKPCSDAFSVLTTHCGAKRMQCEIMLCYNNLDAYVTNMSIMSNSDSKHINRNEEEIRLFIQLWPEKSFVVVSLSLDVSGGGNCLILTFPSH